MSENYKNNLIQSYFESFIDNIIKITGKYLYEGKIEDALLVFESNIQVIDLEDVNSENKAKFLIHYAKILQQEKFIKEFNFEREIEMLSEARKLAESSNFKNLLADALDLIGTCIYSKGIFEGEYYDALEYHNQALQIRVEINDLLGICKSYFNLGLYEEHLKDITEENKRKAFEYYQNGLKIAIENDFKLEQAYFYRHLAYFYQYFENDKKKSLQCHLNSAKIREEIGFKVSLQFSYLAVAMEYFYITDYTNALEYFNKAYYWAKEVGRIEQLRVIIFKRGDYMVNEAETENAIKYFELVLESAEKAGDIECSKKIEKEIMNLSSINETE